MSDKKIKVYYGCRHIAKEIKLYVMIGKHEQYKGLSESLFGEYDTKEAARQAVKGKVYPIGCNFS